MNQWMVSFSTVQNLHRLATFLLNLCTKLCTKIERHGWVGDIGMDVWESLSWGMEW